VKVCVREETTELTLLLRALSALGLFASCPLRRSTARMLRLLGLQRSLILHRPGVPKEYLYNLPVTFLRPLGIRIDAQILEHELQHLLVTMPY
jgi:hypothetical protein